MEQKQKQKIIIFLILVFVITGIVLVVKYRVSEKKYEKIKDIKINTGKYTDIYWKRTKYKKETFTVLRGGATAGNVYHIVYAAPGAIEKKTREDLEFCNSFSPEIPGNTLMDQYISPEEYKKKIDGYEVFEDSETVTSVILMTKDSDWALGYQYVEESPSSVKSLVKATVKKADELGDEANRIDMKNRKEIRNYLKKNGFNALCRHGEKQKEETVF